MKSEQKFWVSTSQQQTGVFTTTCPDTQCNMVGKWDLETSKSAKNENLGRSDLITTSNFNKKN